MPTLAIDRVFLIDQAKLDKPVTKQVTGVLDEFETAAHRIGHPRGTPGPGPSSGFPGQLFAGHQEPGPGDDQRDREKPSRPKGDVDEKVLH